MRHADPTIDEAGFVVFAGERMDPAEAIRLAYRLTQACEDSVWRSQRGQSWYYDSERIIQRAESALGRAKKALSEVYGMRFKDGQLVEPEAVR